MENSNYPPTEEELERIKSNLSETSEYIKSLRETFRKHFKKYRKLKDIFEGLSERQKREEQRMRTFVAELRGVSDSIIITVPLENRTDNCIPINNILATFEGICLIFNVALSSQKPVRGGIDIGWGVRLTQNEVYGSALVKAYTLETEKAVYPRIVIGESLWKFINYVVNSNPTTKYGTRAKSIAKQCKSLVVKDHDGVYILDVIGKAVKSSTVGINSDSVKKGYDYVRYQLAHKKKDSKLGPRYKLLKNYYDERLHLWGF